VGEIRVSGGRSVRGIPCFTGFLAYFLKMMPEFIRRMRYSGWHDVASMSCFTLPYYFSLETVQDRDIGLVAMKYIAIYQTMSFSSDPSRSRQYCFQRRLT